MPILGVTLLYASSWKTADDFDIDKMVLAQSGHKLQIKLHKKQANQKDGKKVTTYHSSYPVGLNLMKAHLH